MKFKTHMILWAQTGEGFRTVCGIDDGCSESFFERGIIVDFGDQEGTTCKRCLTKYQGMLKMEEKADPKPFTRQGATTT